VARALALFALYVVVFAAGGGIGAGVPSLVFELMTGQDLARGDQFMLYAIMFGVTGYIAVRLAQRVVEGGEPRI
jgi:hypothetical protein